MGYILGAVLELKDKSFTSTVKQGASATGDLGEKLDKNNGKLKSFGDSLKNAGKVAGTFAIGLGAAGVGALGAMTAKTVEAAAEISKFSQVNGMTTKGFQEWDYAAKSVGFSMEAASGDIAALAERAMDATSGVGENAEMFKKLGVSVTDSNGKLKSQEQLFNDTIAGLQGMENATERNAIATAMLSTTGEELAPILNMTGSELDKLKGKANIISESDLKKSEDFRMAVNEMKTQFGGLFTELAMKAMPTLQKFVDYGVEKLPVLKEKFKSAFEAAKPTLVWLKDEGLPLVTSALDGVLGGATSVYNFIKDNWSVISPFVIGIATAIGVWKAVTLAHSAVTGIMTGAQWALNVAMNANPIGLIVIGIGLLIGAGILLYKNWDKVKNKAISLWETTKEKFAGIKESVTTSLQPVMDFFGRLKDKWDSFKDSISNFKMPKIGMPKWMGGKGLIQGSHATGLRRVPFDGYIAELHRDETVLPKSEAERYRKGDSVTNTQVITRTEKSPSPNIQNTFHVSFTSSTTKEMVDEFMTEVNLRLANM